MNRINKKLFSSSVILMSLILILAACGSSKDTAGANSGKEITMGSKNFTENILVAEMMAQLIEAKTDIKVNRKLNLGGSNVVWTALKNNEIQLYPDYTGTVVANYYQEKTGTAEETLERAKELVKQDKLVFLDPLGFNNTYTLAVTKSTAEKYNLKTYSDLAKVSPDLVLGVEFEFLDRDDGYPGVQKLYNMNFKTAKGMDHGIMYQAIKGGETDVTNAYSTDAQIKANDLVILEDDKQFFPPYYAAPIIRQDTLDQYPEIADVLKTMNDSITEEDMQDLNGKVDIEGLKEDQVAHDFLVEKGLIES
ncbi:glycine betaine ABC transporter substrate-binding protein [Paenibacillus physcomitrellae]|uniref:Glycine/betaine ABC transporter n=2 Tax=Paenibacillus physcomitrellae TaxID=1619311 RepID=A0ABQ1FX15_9BACL|nr:glycine betaine ABC transporter substrate-binding protein [Paenibacillus physcomitrellae]GGA33041.1 glycine/betaine ABC transporter [Paenibacillus physcomitrellae]